MWGRMEKIIRAWVANHRILAKKMYCDSYMLSRAFDALELATIYIQNETLCTGTHDNGCKKCEILQTIEETLTHKGGRDVGSA